MRFFTIFTAVLIIFFQDSLAAEANDIDIMVMKDISYKHSSNISEKFSSLDLYYDQNSSSSKLMVFVHGGSWVGGDKGQARKESSLRKWFINKGYAVAVPNFRLATKPKSRTQITYKEQAQDIAQSISWLLENRRQYDIKDESVLLVGFSSGAHLVALLSSDEKYLQNEGLSLNNIVGSISLDVHAYDVPYALELMKISELKAKMKLINHLFGYSRQQQLQGSPIHYIKNANVPPTLLISAEPSFKKGSKGRVAKMTAQNYQKALQNAGHLAKSFHFDNETHNSLVLDFGAPNDKPTYVVEKFLSHIKK